ncbi:MAG: nucleoside triphosphate pyrophosphohydrolase [Rhodospirillales bacterium]|nr:nucleoside triphosphate pyrophosphohydrolase [Rhodospirillales bacterium]
MTEHTIDRLKWIMARLRDPETGCPWDVEQNFASIAPYTIEEAYEVADAIEAGDMEALKDELGDLLLQVIFHSQMADERRVFDFDDVTETISDKMVRRHPHVFEDEHVGDAEAQTRAWEETKARERKARAADDPDHSALDGVAKGLPALLRALKLQKRAARVGFDWPGAEGALAKLREEIDELSQEVRRPGADKEKLADELGDVLFSVVNLARKLGMDPEAALRHGNAKFERRFRIMERRLKSAGRDLNGAGLDEMEAEWRQAKAAE